MYRTYVCIYVCTTLYILYIYTVRTEYLWLSSVMGLNYVAYAGVSFVRMKLVE